MTNTCSGSASGTSRGTSCSPTTVPASPRKPSDEAIEAAHGEIEAELTRLNSDANDTGEIGPQAVEVYQPLFAGSQKRPVGVLELYLPYAPIHDDVAAGLRRLSLDLMIGLAALYVVLFGISLSVSRGLRRQVKINAFLAEHDPLTELPNRRLFQRRIADGARTRERRATAVRDRDRRPRPLQGHQRLARASQRRLGARRARVSPRSTSWTVERHDRAARRRRVRHPDRRPE